MRKIDLLCWFIVVLAVTAAVVGVFYTTGEPRFTVENIYGESIELFGDGIYKYNSVLKAGANKGADIAMLMVAMLFSCLTVLRSKSVTYRYMHVGLLSGLLYYSACLVFGVTFNRLFPVYVLLFSSALFAMIFLLGGLMRETRLPEKIRRTPMKGTAVFLIICGSSVLLWLQFIIPALITGQPLSNIEVYTTEPTFVLDLAIVFPVYIGCAIALFQKRDIGYKLAPVLLTFIIIIGLTVICQTIVQTSMGIHIPVPELISLVVSFIILGVVAFFLNRRVLTYL